MHPIKLMKSTFYEERSTKEKLCDFIMKSEKLSMGDSCSEFENDFSKWQGSKYTVLFNSGSSANLALIQSLLNLGRLNRGDVVALSAVTWATNVMPIIQLGLIPVLIDVCTETLNVTCKHLQDAFFSKPDIKCFFITNLLGFCSNLDEISTFCSDNNIILIEDNCESLGSVLKGKKLGNYGIGSSFSFFVGHHISAIEGGAVCTNDFAMYEMLKMVRAHGWSRSLSKDSANELMCRNNISDFYNQYTFYELGYNLRPTEITGYIGSIQIKYADLVIKRREENFKVFQNATKNAKSLELIDVGHLDVVSNFAYPIVCRSRKVFEKSLKLFEQNKIEVRPLVGGAMSRQPFYKKYSDNSTNLVNSNIIHDFGFYMPNNPELTDLELERMVSCLEDISNF